MSASSADSPAPDREAREAVIKSMLYHKLVEDRRIPPKELGIPLKQTFPRDWNFHFECALRLKYGPDADLRAWMDENYDQGMLTYLGDLPACKQDIIGASTTLLRIEGVLAARAIEELVDRGFEQAWTALEEGTKTGFVLDGLVRAAYKVRQESRFDCPEMAVVGLVGDGEYNLINLLKAIVAHDSTGNRRVKSMYLFHHPAVEREHAYITKPHIPDDLRAFGHLRMLQRNLYIVHTLIGILDAYAGTPAPKISIMEERALKSRALCYACSALATPDGTVTLQQCSACKLVTYCSSACQHRDWPAHKKLCRMRSEHFDSAALTPAPEPRVDFIGCPAPVPGFVRSPALWRQIESLSQPDSYARDYHFDTGPDRTTSIRIPDPGARLTFLIARRRALATGDVRAVRKMHEILSGLQRAGVVPVTLPQLTGQLEREYRVVLGTGNSEQLNVAAAMEFYGPMPMPQETLEEVQYASRRDALARPPAPQGGGGEGGLDLVELARALATLAGLDSDSSDED